MEAIWPVGCVAVDMYKGRELKKEGAMVTRDGYPG